MSQIFKRDQLESELSNPDLSQNERYKLLHKLYRLDHKPELGLFLLFLVSALALGIAAYILNQ